MVKYCWALKLAIIGYPASVDVKQHKSQKKTCSELRSCVKVEVAVPGSRP